MIEEQDVFTVGGTFRKGGGRERRNLHDKSLFVGSSTFLPLSPHSEISSKGHGEHQMGFATTTQNEVHVQEYVEQTRSRRVVYAATPDSYLNARSRGRSRRQ